MKFTLSHKKGISDLIDSRQETVQISRHKLEAVKNILRNLQTAIGQVSDLLESAHDGKDLKSSLSDLQSMSGVISSNLGFLSNEQSMEGVFDGQNMVGQDGSAHEVPANYSSKSKLVEGDILKVTIRPDGSKMFKQISPVERKREVGVISVDENSGNYYVMCRQNAYKVNNAAVTFYKCQIGDQAIVLVPKDGISAWGAIEGKA